MTKNKKLTKQQLVAHGYYSNTAKPKHKNLEFFTVFQDIIYLFTHSTVSCKTPNDISVEPLAENTLLETVNGSNRFSFSDTKEKTKLFYLWFSKILH
jgi:hypothetical protein